MCGDVRSNRWRCSGRVCPCAQTDDQEGQKLQRIVRRGSTSSVRYRRAMMLLASVGGNRVPVIAQLVQADEDTVRDVIHRFNEIGLACLDSRWAGGCPLQLCPNDEDFVVQTATTRPANVFLGSVRLVAPNSCRTAAIQHASWRTGGHSSRPHHATSRAF
ncbi:hypothetical protein MBT84_39510 [Streptomyces sp. MBT84]|nr:hypothetical protein [Streptomyces sp. MBT84]